MHLVNITGFLGTGKTTLLLRLANFAWKQDKKVVILVNEVGEIGVDNQMMKELGFNVQELLGGCICCTLAGNVIETLKELQETYQPDLVLLEPSGAADPRNLIKVLAESDIVSFESRTNIALVDALRMDMLMTVASPLVTSTIELADLLLINKADAATPEELSYTQKIALDHLSQDRVFSVSVQNDLSPKIIGEILPWIK